MFSKQNFALFAQFAVSTAIGCAVFLHLSGIHENPKTPLIGALVVGFFGGWGAMYAYTFLRYGWDAAKSLKWDG